MTPRARCKRYSAIPFLCAGIFVATLPGISRASPQATGQGSQLPEVTTNETQPSFRLQVQRNLVLVRVVVRDAQGRIAGNLGKEDFRLSDNRKPQVISGFSVVTPASPPAVQPQPSPQEPAITTLETERPAPGTGLRYLALLFDDLYTSFEDLARSRDAADRFLGESLAPGKRVGIFTASGLNTLDFTANRAKLHEALLGLRINSRINARGECPEISDYQARQIADMEDRQAIAVAVEEDIVRCHEYPRGAEERVRDYARRAYGQYEYQARIALQNIGQLVRRMAVLPGQRNVVLVSPGFLPLGQRLMLGEIVDRTLRSNVIISSLDPRGLPVLVRVADASRRYPPSGSLLTIIQVLDSAREVAASEVLSELADDTGGEFFHNNNDLTAGFARVAGTPETYYVLAFTPQNLKYDGSFHKLKVTLAGGHGYTVRTRRGYFAPGKLPDAAAEAKEEIETAAFSQDEVKELPIAVHTRYFKAENGDVHLTVLVHLDIRALRFRREAERNVNELTFVSALFDRDGNFVTGKKTTTTLRLRDSTLEQLLEAGITLRTSLVVKPGTYLLREVVRDSEDGHLSAVNSSVEIPY